MILIGYSGHAFVAHSIFASSGIKVTGYCDNEEKLNNPFSIPYIGNEFSTSALNELSAHGFFIAIGSNKIRRNIYNRLTTHQLFPANAIHATSIIDTSAFIESHGIMIGAGSVINPLSKIGDGAICNTGCIIEHECEVGKFSHIAPGSILCGNVKVGENSFVGAGSVVREGIHIGNNVIIGAGSVVVKDVPDHSSVLGNPARPFDK